MYKLKLAEKGFANLIVLAGMLVLAISLPLTTKLVQQNQENRSNAAATTGTCRCYTGSSQGVNASSWSTKTLSSCKAKCSAGACKCTAFVVNPATVKCTYTYSSWNPKNCPPSGKQTRTVTSRSPDGCKKGSPEISQTCTYHATEDRTRPDGFTCAANSECSSGFCNSTTKKCESEVSCYSNNCSECINSSDCKSVGCYWEKLTKQCIPGTPTDDSTFFYYDPDSKNCVVTVSYSTLDVCKKYKRGACFKTVGECNTVNNNCTSKGGSCISSYDHCSGTFQSNLCPGDSSIKCCIAQCNNGNKKCDKKQMWLCADGNWSPRETCDNGCNNTNTACAPAPTPTINFLCAESLNRCINSKYVDKDDDETYIKWYCVASDGRAISCQIARSIIDNSIVARLTPTATPTLKPTLTPTFKPTPKPTQYLIHESDPYYDDSNQNWLSVEDDVDISQSSTSESNSIAITGKNTDFNHDSTTNAIDFSKWKVYVTNNDLKGDVDGDGAVTSLDGNIIKLNM